ncbi:MAG: tRNA (N(6)-L-threonylcarbamoyladenosine(37)-C(2))-methylthiotransferase MtaB [Candidatus Omnitrophica bacterium]|nr:tRNA (N(6)-L-threonylcarbamoyladenosine(37)-C(2))-methylthiotransferase MtaB [Candidatus Omnitrophota bacterium]
MGPTVSFFTLGCRLNQSETAVLEGLFRDKGFCVVDFKDRADIFVVNSCTVTSAGDAAARYAMKKAIALHSQVRIAIIGCQAQVQRERLLALPNVQWVIGTARKMRLADILWNDISSREKKILVPYISRNAFTMPLTLGRGRRTRANLKVQDGCDNFCAYCEIPYARGRSRSRKFSNVIAEAHALAHVGHQEIVLTGVNIGDYKDDTKCLMDVVKGLEMIKGIVRIRISSIESTKIPRKLVRFMNRPHKLCRFLHVPVQSGCDKLLKRMGRTYATAEFSSMVRSLVKKVPGIMIGTDVIVGFPGETPEDFEETVRFLTKTDVHYIHVFSYSHRYRARSRRFEGEVPASVISSRSRVLRRLSAQKRGAFLGSLLGRRERALFEHKKNEYWIGHLDNYVTIKIKSDHNLKNVFADVILEKVDGEVVLASLANSGKAYGSCSEDQGSYHCVE